jgi:hypothetical protein
MRFFHIFGRVTGCEQQKKKKLKPLCQLLNKKKGRKEFQISVYAAFCI